jgi:hypothetical protein
MIIHDRVEKLLWSIALPGFGQILNGDLLKGLLFIALEFLICFLAPISEKSHISISRIMACVVFSTSSFPALVNTTNSSPCARPMAA